MHVDRIEMSRTEDKSQGGRHLIVLPFWLKSAAHEIFLRPPALGVGLLAKFVSQVSGYLVELVGIWGSLAVDALVAASRGSPR